MNYAAKALTIGIAAATLAGCSRDGDLDVAAGVGVNVTRSGCPTVAVPDGTGDITIFNPVNSTDAEAIDVVATITNIRPTCNESGEKIFSQATFDVQARRNDARGTRTVIVPYFNTVVQGGSAVIAKRVGQVTLQFADGQHAHLRRRKRLAILTRTLPACPLKSCRKSPRSVSPVTPTRRLTLWPIPKCAQRLSDQALKCSSVFS